jgi:hypothetical protein
MHRQQFRVDRVHDVAANVRSGDSWPLVGRREMPRRLTRTRVTVHVGDHALPVLLQPGIRVGRLCHAEAVTTA